MAPPASPRPLRSRRASRRGAAVLLALAALAIGAGIDGRPARAQLAQQQLVFPARPTPPPRPPAKAGADKQMLVRADEVDYDYTNDRVSAAGNVQIYYSGSTLESDRVIYDQKTKRLHAEGNVRLTDADGKITYGQIIDLSDNFRDGFVDSLRLDLPEQTRVASSRAQRTSGNFTVFENGVYTACEPCKDNPLKPPEWQVKAARIIHDQGEQMMYFEDARIEFYGVPLAYMPYFSAPDPTVKRKTGFLMPMVSTSSLYGVGMAVPFYWSLAPDYDVTVAPLITSRQGPLLQAEWRQRLVNGSYNIRAAGIFQLDRQQFVSAGDTPGDRNFRGTIQSSGQFSLSDKWVWGWDTTVLTDKTFISDYQLGQFSASYDTLGAVLKTPDYALSQLYLAGRGDRSYFDARTMYFYGFSASDVQGQIPVVLPVIDHDYTVDEPIVGGELSFHNNLTSITRQSANFDPISAKALGTGLCTLNTADTSAINPTNCVLRGVPGTYTRFSTEVDWRRTFIDPYGEMFTPFFSLRADVADVQVSNQPGVSNYINTGGTDIARAMPTAGLEYKYPFISVQSWGTQTIEPIAQVVLRPNETQTNALPNEDAQSLIFDDSNLFKIDKFSGWDRVEGGGRVNAGVQYSAQFNRGGNVNLLFGESYQLFGLNSFAVGGLTNTGIDSGLDTTRSDYIARASYQPNSTYMFTSRFRFDESTFAVKRMELETSANFGRWNTTLMYGDYAAQPALGLDERQGILANGRFKLNENWVLLGGALYDLRAEKFSQTQIGLGYIDDCLILALNYMTSYSYSGSTAANSTIFLQLSLRTLGGGSVGTGTSAISNGLSGLH
ncbi:MAG TPA: LPS-assembly protein LptD [Xanthobacteraceae bacterium]|nr:LPS-assembly protein LptD [Xanthobacteraceae bacterium]